MSVLINTSESIVISSGLRFKVIPKDSSNSGYSVHELPTAVKLPTKDDSEAHPEGLTSEESKFITTGCVSPDGTFMALCDDRKQLTLWRCHDWTLIHQWCLSRRASKVTFSKDSKSVLVADKGGDVFQFTPDVPEGNCILGHLSMLLDIKISACGHFVITCDRDEKIRVSHFPNAYNIHNFCLGHTEFVTGIELCPHDPTLLCSVSGDGSLKVWKFAKGQELSSLICSKDVPVDAKESGEPNGHPNVKRGEFPAVTQIRCWKISEEESRIFVTVDGFRGILVYGLKGSDGQITFVKSVVTDGCVVDFSVDEKSKNILVIVCGQTIRLLSFDRDLVQRGEVGTDNFFEDKNDISKCIGVDSLYKRWFDNVQEYMERKEERIKSKARNADLSSPDMKRSKLQEVNV